VAGGRADTGDLRGDDEELDLLWLKQGRGVRVELRVEGGR
jgi:hypothetical protein